MGGFSTERKSGTGWSRETPTHLGGVARCSGVRRAVELRGRDLRVTLGCHAGRRQVRWGCLGRFRRPRSAPWPNRPSRSRVADRRKPRGNCARRKLPPPRGRLSARPGMIRQSNARSGSRSGHQQHQEQPHCEKREGLEKVSSGRFSSGQRRPLPLVARQWRAGGEHTTEANRGFDLCHRSCVRNRPTEPVRARSLRRSVWG